MHRKDSIAAFRKADEKHPLRIMVSACLAGTLCGYDGTSNGVYPQMGSLLSSPNVAITRFCPEEYSFGSPREMCDIHGGDGFDVLDGKAKVLTASGEDWTRGMLAAAEKMLQIAKEAAIEVAVVMDISAACGSTVIYNGHRFAEDKQYQMGVGVASAMLIRNGIQVISQRDFALLELLYAAISDNHQMNPQAKNHHQTEWYINYFKIKI